jgi:hypothetical protein
MTTGITTNDHAISDIGLDDVPFDNDSNYGFYSCEWFTSTPGNCDHAHIIYNQDRTGLPYDTRRAVACQEVGHSVGLRHGPYGCMPSPLPANPNSNYGPHNVDHIDSRY